MAGWAACAGLDIPWPRQLQPLAERKPGGCTVKHTEECDRAPAAKGPACSNGGANAAALSSTCAGNAGPCLTGPHRIIPLPASASAPQPARSAGRSGALLAQAAGAEQPADPRTAVDDAMLVERLRTMIDGQVAPAGEAATAATPDRTGASARRGNAPPR